MTPRWCALDQGPTPNFTWIWHVDRTFQDGKKTCTVTFILVQGSSRQFLLYAVYSNKRTSGEKFGKSSHVLNFALLVSPRDKSLNLGKNQERSIIASVSIPDIEIRQFFWLAWSNTSMACFLATGLKSYTFIHIFQIKNNVCGQHNHLH